MNPVLKAVLGAAAGALAGYIYYKFIGCRTGACPIAGNPWAATVWWAIIGGMLGSGIK